MPANDIKLNIFRDNLQWFVINGKWLTKCNRIFIGLLSLGDKLPIDSYAIASCIAQFNEFLGMLWKNMDFMMIIVDYIQNINHQIIFMGENGIQNINGTQLNGVNDNSISAVALFFK